MLISAAYAATEAAGAAPGFFAEPENWVAIAFLIVVALLVRPVSRALAKTLDGRRDDIKRRLDEAAKLHAEAQALLAQHQKRQREAQKDADEMLASARAEAARMKEAGVKELEELLKRREQQALARIDQAEAEALAEVRGVAIDLAMEAARRIIAENMTPEKSAQLADKTIEDLGEHFH